MTVKNQRTSTRIKAVAGTIGLCLVGGSIAACGGSSSTHVTTHQSRPTPSQSNPDVGSAHAQVATAGQQTSKHRSSTTHQPAFTQPSTGATPSFQVGSTQPHTSTTLVTEPKVQHARSTPGTNEDQHRVPSGPNPCALVTLPEAEAIIGARIAGRTEAPLGPTCIYKLGGAKADVTLAVESLSFPQVTHRMTRRAPVTVGTHQAYCGKLGSQMLFVPLNGGRVLNVTAPCGIAKRFAAVALTRLTA